MSGMVFVDARVQDLERLIAGLAADVQVVILDPTRDGVAQIAEALAGVTDLDSVHIVSHGSSGTLYLGSTILTEDNLGEYETELAQIGDALSDDGDILLYGCNVGAGVTGQSFISSLADRTGADVAASTDATGNALLGGNWALEANNGAIEARAIAPASFEGLLLAPTRTAAGTLDDGFDTDGKLTTDFAASSDAIKSMVLQADGTIVVAGVSSGNFALARYNADGSLDTTFGSGGTHTDTLGAGVDEVTSMALQADGRIVVAGVSSGDFALARYNADGTLDTTFSGDGKLTTAIGAGVDEITSMALQADGKIVVAGTSFIGGSNDFALARYNADGTLDTTFSGDGKLTTAIGVSDDQITSMALQTDGKILVAGSSIVGGSNDFALARYNADGTLDTTFSGDGKLTMAIGGSDDQISSMVLQADGRIVVAGYSAAVGSFDFALARYDSTGALDITFNFDVNTFTGGTRTDSIGAGNDLINSVALQADGKIVVAGTSFIGANNDDFALARYNADGTLDTTFSGDGKLTIPVAGNNIANSVQVQADGAIVAAGVSGSDFALVRVVGGPGIPDVTATENSAFSFIFNANSFTDPEGNPLTYTVGALPAWLSFDPATRTFSGTPGSANVGSSPTVTVTATDAETLNVNDSFVIRVQNNDAPTLFMDRGFDHDGRLTTAIGAGDDQINGLALQADGKIVVAGYAVNTSTTNNTDFALARYNADGGLDTTFSSDGKLTTTFGAGIEEISSVVLQIDGKIVVAGAIFRAFSALDFALARYNANGTLDTTFSGDGLLFTEFSANPDVINSMALQADGKIVVGGYSSNGTDDDFALARYNTGGGLDTTFSGDGKLTTAIGASDDVINSLALQGDGKIVVAGYSVIGGNTDFAVARYNTNGTLDTTFSGDGKLTTAIGAGEDVITGMALQANGKIVVAGYSINNRGNADFALARYNANGTLDVTFDHDGRITTAIGLGDDQIASLALQADGKIVVAGHSFNGTNDDFALARYNTNGSLDTTFDGDGRLTIPAGPGNDYATGVKVQSDGAIVVAGYDSTIGDFAVIRVLSNAPGIADQTIAHGTPLNYAITGYTDPEGGQIVYGATLVDGSALPAWLGFGGAISTFSGAPIQSDVGRYDISFTATDIWGASSFDVFALAVTNTAGTGGNDTLYGGLGADTMTGFAGNDVYTVDNAGDGVVEASNAGTDLVRASLTHTLAADVEKLALTGGANIDGTGNGLNNTLTGNSGNNVLDGGAGIDIASYANAVAAVTVDLSIPGAQNTVSMGSDTLTHIENLLGSSFDDTLTGNSDDNSLVGGGRNDTLNGGSGNDSMTGGGGNDTYVVNATGDVVTEATSAGTDLIRSSVSIAALVDNVEKLTLTGSANLNGAGNGLANTMIGNSGLNVLNGGAGADTLVGGAGNDTYVVDRAADLVTEVALGGTDLIQSSVTIAALAANVEKLTLTGAAAINGTGNGLANTITGNAAANTLNGGTGADALIGLGGSDTYVVDNAGDVVTEAAVVGTDLIRSTVTIAALAANVEKLTLTGGGNLNGTGNALANTLTGNAGANVLNGSTGNDTMAGVAGNDILGGGAGNDRLTGGTGADKFDFNTALNAATNLDRITDFNVADDVMRLDDNIFTAFSAAAPTLAAGVFYKAPGAIAAHDANDRIVYNTTTGNLYYDADGQGGTAATLFATLTGAPAITAADFFIVA